MLAEIEVVILNPHGGVPSDLHSIVLLGEKVVLEQDRVRGHAGELFTLNPGTIFVFPRNFQLNTTGRQPRLTNSPPSI
jgi:hypothetical protein